MALLALDLGMFTHQRETRFVMVERRFLPGPVVVAFLTFRPLLSFVFVVFFVAGEAIHRRILVPLIGMAVLAFGVDVFAAERVTRLVVIELRRRVLPVLLGMTVCAGRAQVFFVFVVLLVAGITIGRRVAILGFGLMAGLALDLLGVGMGALERGSPSARDRTSGPSSKRYSPLVPYAPCGMTCSPAAL